MTLVRTKSGRIKIDGRNFADILQEKLITGEDLIMDHNPCEKVVRLEQIIVGNGSPGISGLVAAHETFIQRMKGGFILIGFVGIANIAGLVIVIIKLFSK